MFSASPPVVNHPIDESSSSQCNCDFPGIANYICKCCKAKLVDYMRNSGIMCSEITANGYITQLGLFHDNMFNKFNLSSDLMEPFRVLVDRLVVEIKPDKFDKEEKLEFVYMFEDEVMIDGKRQYVNNAIKQYCKSVFDALNDQDASLIKFYKTI